MVSVCGLFFILRVLAICYSACSFCISTIAFLIAAARCITEGDGVSNLII